MNGPPGAEEVQEIECSWKVIRDGSAEDKGADPDPCSPARPADSRPEGRSAVSRETSHLTTRLAALRSSLLSSPVKMSAAT